MKSVEMDTEASEVKMKPCSSFKVQKVVNVYERVLLSNILNSPDDFYLKQIKFDHMPLHCDNLVVGVSSIYWILSCHAKLKNTLVQEAAPMVPL